MVMMGVFRSSTQMRAVQSPTVMKNLLCVGLRWME